jgi:tellurite resistance protein TerC
MARQDEQAIEPEANPVIRLVRRLVPVTGAYHGPSFFIREPAGDGGRARRLATPLFIVLVLVETTDLIFAVDSIPAVFAVTRDPFLVYSSNVFAILGLRALYFLLSGVIGKFRHLKFGLSVVLIFVGGKMLVADVYKVPIGLSLGIIAAVIGASILTSLFFPARSESPPPAAPIDDARSVPELTGPDKTSGEAR